MINVGGCHSVVIEDTNIFGKGVCHVENIVVFVDGAVKGESCNIEITKIYPRYAYAVCKEILEKAEHRITPVCSCYGKCGGCSFLHITQEFENEIKYNYVKSAFAKQKIEVELEKTVCPVDDKYRNKVILFYDGASFGYMAEGTNKIVKHSSCMLNDAIFDEIAEFTAKELGSTTVRALYLRKSNDNEQIMVCPIFFEKTDAVKYATALVNRFPNVVTVITGVLKDREFAQEKVKFSTLYGDGYIYDTLCGLKFRISPESFYQVNHTCAELLYEKAIELADLTKDSVCADLFCGTGTIGIIAAHKTGATVYGVEIVEKAIKDAKFNAQENGIKTAHFTAMDAGKFDKQVDTCIIDPPRKGCSPFMIDTLKRLKPKKIVYVS